MLAFIFSRDSAKDKKRISKNVNCESLENKKFYAKYQGFILDLVVGTLEIQEENQGNAPLVG